MKNKLILQFVSCFFVFAFLNIQTISAKIDKTKVACVGNSITWGAGLASPATQSYPPQMQILLGDSYEVLNFGVSSRTMLKKGDYPFWNDLQYTNALAFNPDFVVIKLGTNDSKSFQWPFYKNEYPIDYKDMIRSFQALPSKPQVIMCMLVPGQNIGWSIYDTVMRDEVNPVIKQIALDEGLPLIDLYTVFSNGSPEWIQGAPDGVHPTIAGSGVIAEEVKKMITLVKPHITLSGNNLIAPDADGYQWYYNGKSIPEAEGGIAKELTYTKSGKYKVSIKLTSGSETRVISNEYNLSYLQGNYKITGKYSLMNLAVEGKNSSDGALVKQNIPDTSKNQVWQFVKYDPVYYQLINTNSNKSATVEAGSNLAGANIVQSTFNGSDIQLWNILDQGKGLYSVVNKSSGFAITVEGNSMSEGAQLIQDTLKSTENQLFGLSLVQTVQTPFYGSAFEIPGIFEAEDFDYGGEGLAFRNAEFDTLGNYRNNEGVAIQHCSNCNGFSIGSGSINNWIEYSVNVTDTNDLIFDFKTATEFNNAKIRIFIDGIDKTGSLDIPQTGGTDIWKSVKAIMKLSPGEHILRITNDGLGVYYIDKITVCKNIEGSYILALSNNGKAVTVTGSQTTEDASIVQSTPTGETGQQWNVTYAREGFYKIENVNSAKVLSVTNDTVIQKTYTGADNQMWQFISNNKGFWIIRNEEADKLLQAAENSQSNSTLMLTKNITSDGNFLFFITAAPYARQPFKGTSLSIPGVIEAEDYDLGGESVGYHDIDGNVSSPLYRSNEGVDLEVCVDGGYDVYNIKAGEWLKYSVSVESTAEYVFTVKSSKSKCLAVIGIDNNDSITTIEVPSSGNPQVWKAASKNIQLTAGNHIIRVYFFTGSTNFDKITVTNASTSISEVKTSELRTYPNPVTEGFINIELPALAEGTSEISITDISGNIIFKKYNCQQNERIDLSNYPTGLYFLKFKNNNNAVVEKFIKN